MPGILDISIRSLSFVRYFGEQLRSHEAEAWKECNRRLYSHYRTQFLPLRGPARARPKLLLRGWPGSCRRGSIRGRIMLLACRASDEMLRRARRALGETGSRTLRTVWGGTFHSVAN